MPTVQLYEFGQISSRPEDKDEYERWEKNGKSGKEPSWVYAKDLPDKLEMLNKGGKIIMYLPNYMVPFEMHFFIPIIINKKITNYFLLPDAK